jgi:hypothetical protein
MAILKAEDIINKKLELDKELETKTTLIFSKTLKGEIEFHSIGKGGDFTIKDFRDMAKSTPEKAGLYLIYMSSDILRDKTLLKTFGCDKHDQYKIVEKVFPKEVEREEVLEIIFKLNGIVDPDGSYIKEVEEEKN